MHVELAVAKAKETVAAKSSQEDGSRGAGPMPSSAGRSSQLKAKSPALGSSQGLSDVDLIFHRSGVITVLHVGLGEVVHARFCPEIFFKRELLKFGIYRDKEKGHHHVL
jgi:hypothetical protein